MSSCWNNSRVIPARLRGVNAATGGAFEILCSKKTPQRLVGHDETGQTRPPSILKSNSPKKFPRPSLPRMPRPSAPEIFRHGKHSLELDSTGELPLPPYIEPRPKIYRPATGALSNRLRGNPPALWRRDGRTALHEKLLAELRARGVEIHFVTLHVGLGTFAPVKAETLSEHASCTKSDLK